MLQAAAILCFKAHEYDGRAWDLRLKDAAPTKTASRFASEQSVSKMIFANLCFQNEHSVQTYGSNRRLTRIARSLKTRARQCNPMVQILQTYG